MRYDAADDARERLGLLRHDRRRTREDAIDGIKVDRDGNLYVCGPGGIWVLSPDGEHLGTLRLPEAPHNLAWGDADGRTLYITALTSVYRLRLDDPGHPPRRRKERRMSKGLERRRDAARLRAARRERRLHRLSELQGDDAMVLHARPRRALPARAPAPAGDAAASTSWCAVAFTQLVTVLPNDLHDVYKLKISTGAHWTYLADTELEVQTALDIREYTDPHHAATVPHTLVLAPGPRDRQGLRRLLVLGPARRRTSCGRTSATSSARIKPDFDPTTAEGEGGVGGRRRERRGRGAPLRWQRRPSTRS